MDKPLDEAAMQSAIRTRYDRGTLLLCHLAPAVWTSNPTGPVKADHIHIDGKEELAYFSETVEQGRVDPMFTCPSMSAPLLGLWLQKQVTLFWLN